MGTLLEVAQGHRIEEDNTIMLSFGVSSALLVVSFVLLALLEHSELAVNSFCNLVGVFQECVPCHGSIQDNVRISRATSKSRSF